MLEFNESLEVDRLQSALTRQFLIPVLPALEAMFLELRAETDRTLNAETGAKYGQAYPYGYCMEITEDVLRRLSGMMNRPVSVGDRALSAFVRRGGRVNSIWGVLRDRYFQNAIKVGSLYIDVANDTVDIRKPKIEILPIAKSGLELVRDAAHYARIGESYWQAKFYANTALPELAPYFPMIVRHPKGYLQLASRNMYMVRLFARNGFDLAQAWLLEGPRLSDAAVGRLRAACPGPSVGDATGLDAALEACRRERRRKRVLDGGAIANLLASFDRVPWVKEPEVGSANAHPDVSVSLNTIQ